MAKRVSVYVSIFAAAVLATVAGCKKAADGKAAAAAAQEEQARQDAEEAFFQALDAAFMKVNELLEQARTNEVVALFEALEADPRWKDWSERLFSERIRFQLYAGQDESVRAEVLRLCADGPVAHARTGLHMLLFHLHETRGLDAAYAFADAVAATPGVADELVRLTTEWRFSNALRASDMARASEALAAVLRTFPAADANRILENAFDTLFAANRLDDIDAVRALAAAGADADRDRLLEATAVRLAAHRADWPETERLFSAAAAGLPDDALQRLLSQVLPAAHRADRHDVVDRCAEEVIFKQAAKRAAADRAARFWIESAMATNRAAFPRRLQTLLDAKISANTVANLFTRYFYELINDTAIIGQVLPVADTLLGDADTDIETAKIVKTMRLDGAFILEDYDKAIACLEKGIPDRDDFWHKMALCKVKAHRALKNNELREAVRFFRAFMDCIDDVKDDDTVDPSTQIQHTKDMLRGRNAKRIAEILAAIPDADAAARAREEASGYYKKALEETRDDEVRAIILAEAGDLLK